MTKTKKSFLGAAMAGLTLALIIAATQPAAAATPKSFYGVSPQTGLSTADLDRMGKAKVGTLRIPIFWSSVQPAPGAYDFSAVDLVVAGAAQNNIRVLPFLFGTPAWVANGLNGSSCTSECDTVAPTTPQALAAWTAFVRAAVDRYGANGTFWAENPALRRKPVKAWQIWNEPNSRTFFAPKAKPKRYVKLLRSAASAVNSSDRRADVVLGGMAQLAGSKKAVPGSKYLRKLYNVKGAKRSFDGVAIHPYGSKIKKVADQVDLFTDEMKAARDKRAELWITEIGAGSATRGNPLNRGKKGQAKILKDSYSYFEDERKRLNIETVIWFSWMDSAVSICDWCETSGLLTQGGKGKPAFRAFTKLTRGR